MFKVSDNLMRQCIDMVANEFDYIYPADGIDENYSVVNLGADGVWIVDNLDDSKVKQIVLIYTFDDLDPATPAIALEDIRNIHVRSQSGNGRGERPYSA